MKNQEIKIATAFGHISIHEDLTLCFQFSGGFLMLNAAEVSISPNRNPNYVVQFAPEEKVVQEKSTSLSLWLNLTENEANKIINQLEYFGEYKFSNQIPYWRDDEINQ